jgi:putative ATPase
VLVLQARSLLWALDPLRQATEGEVVLTLERPDDLERMEAQVQILDPLVRPRLMVVPPAVSNPWRPWCSRGGVLNGSWGASPP